MFILPAEVVESCSTSRLLLIGFTSLHGCSADFTSIFVHGDGVVVVASFPLQTAREFSDSAFGDETSTYVFKFLMTKFIIDEIFRISHLRYSLQCAI